VTAAQRQPDAPVSSGVHRNRTDSSWSLT
jgi:hypothetical protein